MKKAIGQTVRDIKRGVNKKVLKVPSIEQKVLDATSNEPWGPHGSLLADIAHASRNYHEYQMIMTVIWKRINDTGKNWRHVYKALIVLEYLVAYGSERVIDEIKEHSYQISTLSDFQYIDSSARDQGNNVRRKSQALVVLVNDKERIEEARQKAAANRDKFRSASATGGMYKPGSYGERYDDDRYSYDKEREGSYRDDDRYSRNGDPYGRDVDRYSRDSDDCGGRDNYRSDDHRGRSRSVDHYQYGSRSRSADRDGYYDDDGQYSSRGNARADSQSQDGRPPIERKYSDQNLGAPPSYETAVNDAQSPVHKDRDGEYSAASPPKPSSPPATNAMSQSTINSGTSASPVKEVESFDEFDPRNPAAGAPQPTSISAETDFLGSLSDAFSSNTLAIMPAEADTSANSGPEPTSATAPQTASSPFDDPFGDSPFKAILSTNNEPSHQEFTSATTFQGTSNQSTEISQSVAAIDAATNLGFSDMLPGITYAPTSLSSAEIPSENTQYFRQELAAQDDDTDILAGILPPSGPSPSIASQEAFPAPTGQPSASGPSLSMNQQTSFSFPTGQPTQPNANVYGGFTVSTPQTQADAQYYNSSIPPQSASVAPMASQISPQPQTGAMPQQNNMLPSSFISQAGHDPIASQPLTSSVDSLALVPKPATDKFDPKSTVWADTLSRGLVNLNISGAKINPLNDIGIDFDAINRKEKRMEKPAATSVTSNVTMGKAMGSGSGLGRAGAGAIRGPLNPMAGPATGMGMGGMSSGPAMAGMGMGMAGMGMGAVPGMGMSGGPGMGGMGMGGGPGMSGMGMGGGPGMNGMGMGGGPGVGMGIGMAMNGMGMGGGPGAGMGMGAYGGMNQQSMGMGMGQGGAHMQQPAGLPPGTTMPEGYNPVGSGYGPQQPYNGSQQPYNGGYR